MQKTQETWVKSLDWEDPLEKEMQAIPVGIAKSRTQLSN